MDLAWHPSGERIAVAGDRLGLIDLTQGTFLRGRNSRPSSQHVAWLPGGRALVTATPWDHTLSLRDPTNLAPIDTFASPFCSNLSVSPAGYFATICPEDKTVRVFQRDNANAVAEIGSWESGTTVQAGLAFSPDGRHLALATNRRAIALFRSDDWKCEEQIPLPHTDVVQSISWSPDGRRFAVGGWDGRLSLVERESREVLTLVEDRRVPILSVDWSPNGQWIAEAG